MAVWLRTCVAAGAGALVLASATTASAQGGGLDQTFASGGTAKITGSQGRFELGPTALGRSGKTILAVHVFNSQGGAAGAFLERLDTAGHLDKSFGNSGRLTLPVHGLHVVKIVGRPGGALVLGELPTQTDAESTVIVAVTAAGAVDTSYGNQGVATAAPPATNDEPNDLIVTPDGSAIVSQFGYQPSGFRMIRFLPNGQRDTSFGDSGVLATTWSGEAFLAGLAVLPDGGFIAVGGVQPNTRTLVAVAAYNADGTPLASFGNNGRGAYAPSSGNFQGAGALVLAGGDLIIPVDGFGSSGSTTAWLLRVHANGERDASFGTNGGVQVGTAHSNGAIGSFVLDGGRVLIGRGLHDGPFSCAFDRVSAATGAADQTFGAHGELVLNNQGLDVYGVDQHGRIYDSGVVFGANGPNGVIQRRVGS